MFKSIREKLSSAKSEAAKPVGKNNHHGLTKDSLQFSADSLSKIEIGLKDSVPETMNVAKQHSDKVDGGRRDLTDSVHRTLNKPVDGANSEISDANDKVVNANTRLEETVNHPVDELEGRLDSSFSKATGGNVQNPTGDVGLQTGLDTSVNGVEGGQLSEKVPGANTDVPGADKLDVPNEKLGLNELKDKAQVDIPHQEELKDVPGSLNKIDSKLAVGEQYEGAVRDVASGDLSSENVQSTIQQQASNVEPLNNFNQQTQKLTAQQAEYDALIQKYKDKKALQAEIERKAKNVVNDKLNQQSPAFKEANAQLSRTKKLQGDVQSYKEFKEAKKKHVNEMKDKPFRERLVPGITLQAYTLNNVFTTDWGLQSGYKITSRWLAGAGATYRSSFSENHKTWIKGAGVYGYRAYLNVGLVKGLYAHGEFAALYGDVTTRQVENPERHSYGACFGLGKKYAITRKVDGAIIVLYRAHIDGENSNLNKIAMRIEFNYNTKKRKKLY